MADPIARLRAALIVPAAFLAASAAASEYAAAPWLPYRDANPFVAAGGLPLAPPSAAPDSWRVDALLDASNTEIGFSRASEHLLYDAEIHTARIAVTRAFGEHWLVRASLAAEDIGDGFLDGFLKDFHRTFGFSNGDRGHLGSDGHTITYSDATGDRLRFDRSAHAVAPLLVDAAWRMPADTHEWLLGATLKVPTSHSSVLNDDRSTDLSLWGAVQSTTPDTRFPWGLRAGVMRRGDTDLLPQIAKDNVAFADAVLGWRPFAQWEIAAQYQYHSAPYSSDIPLLQSAGTLALSGIWHARAGWSVRAGLVEDLPARHAQDVTFFVGVTL